jgi:hypothetical protein
LAPTHWPRPRLDEMEGEVPAWPSLAAFEMFLSHSIPPPVEVHAGCINQ